MRADVSSWGRYPKVAQRCIEIQSRFSPLPRESAPLLAHGAGRSYGDVCLNPNGVVLRTLALDQFISFDPREGVLECEAGVTIDSILDLVVPRGWFPAVTPGTRFLTVGGAIANDVHGKNHSRFGSFGDHLLRFELLRTDGARLICSPTENSDLFHATIGGLGLTGIITTVSIKLRPLPGAAMRVTTKRFEELSGFFELSEGCDAEYSVAWVDCSTTGPNLGRGVFMAADHATSGKVTRRKGLRWRVPFDLPACPLNRLTLRAFNSLYFHHAGQGSTQRTTHYEAFFYPLDSVEGWNRLYGRAGFVQYQCVVPPEDAVAATKEILSRISRLGEGSFLAVLKNFGSRRGKGLMSFPRPGTTLAMDFPMRGRRTLELLDRLDQVVFAVGGAIYPAKDARMSPAMFARSFPNLRSFRSFVDPGISSGFWRRVTCAE